MNVSDIHFLDELDLEDRRVFVRVDFNAPLEDGGVADDTRIEKAIPTIRQIRDRAESVILASHLGRPGGKPTDDLRMEPVGARLARLLDVDVAIPEDHEPENVETVVDQIDDEQLVLLENLRFDPGERDGDEAFARKLAEPADVYVNDAFGTAHRAHASTYTMAQFFAPDDRGAGELMRTELTHFSELLNDPNRPFTAILGGAKVADKIGVVDALVDRADNILLGGAMAYTFLSADDVAVGDSIVDEEHLELAGEVLQKARDRDVDLILPLDHVVAPSADAPDEEIRTTTDVAIKAGQRGLDIGPNTAEMYSEIIRSSRTVFWNGPMGVFEQDRFADGTMQVARTLALAPPRSVVGGGDSASAVQKAGVADEIDHISTGGGAALKLIERKPLPGLKALDPRHDFD
ncbi:MAG: phosphoglycerate kinase [Bradymonadaceae bacterium]